MANVLYSGKDRRGKKVSGLIEAANNTEALRTLDAMGVTEVLLHTDVSTSPGIEVPAGEDERERRVRARRQIAIRRSPGFATFLANLARSMPVSFFIALVPLLLGLFLHDSQLLVIALVAEVAIVGAAYWSYRRLGSFVGFTKAYARGQWDTALRVAGKLRASSSPPVLLSHLSIMEACIAARRGSTADGLAVLERDQALLETMTPEVYASRTASVYLAGGDYAEAVSRHREASLTAPDSQVCRLDWAMAEACYGDADRAEQILDGVDEQATPRSAQPYLAFVRGVVAWRRHEPNAVNQLETAVSGARRTAQPASWTLLAICTAYYALALYDAGERDRGQRELRRVWDILKHHAHRPLLDALRRRFAFVNAV